MEHMHIQITYPTQHGDLAYFKFMKHMLLLKLFEENKGGVRTWFENVLNMF